MIWVGKDLKDDLVPTPGQVAHGDMIVMISD